MQWNSSGNSIDHYIKILNLFGPESQRINTKQYYSSNSIILYYKKRIDHKIFHSRAKLIASTSDIDEAFKSKHQIIITKTKNYACKDWIVLDAIIKHRIKTLEC